MYFLLIYIGQLLLVQQLEVALKASPSQYPRIVPNSPKSSRFYYLITSDCISNLWAGGDTLTSKMLRQMAHGWTIPDQCWQNHNSECRLQVPSQLDRADRVYSHLGQGFLGINLLVYRHI